jgi:hypothetical protein
MGMQIVVEVRQRSAIDPFLSRELGLFTDDMMADQVITAAYRQLWKSVLSRDFVEDEYLSEYLREAITTQGFDTWTVNDMNSPAPLFYKVKHRLWNQVPSSFTNFTLTMDGAVGI